MVAQQISMTFATVFKDVPPDETLIMKSAAERYSFLVFSITGWMWALSLYLHGWVMNRELTRRKKNLRPNLAISIFPPPNWMLSLLFIAAVASTIGGPSLAFWGKSSLILLMLPYFLLGMALIHEQSKKLPNRKIILIFLYVMLFSLLWVVLLVAGYGFYYHVKLLNKYLSAGGTSSRS